MNLAVGFTHCNLMMLFGYLSALLAFMFFGLKYIVQMLGTKLLAVYEHVMPNFQKSWFKLESNNSHIYPNIYIK